MVKRFFRFISSMQFMSVLLLLFAIVIGYATFIENDFGRATAKALIFNKWWFELILLLLAVNLISNLFRFKLFRLDKLPMLTFHLAFIIILLGSTVTRYFGYEGMMHIREGSSSNSFLSDNTYLQINIHDTKHQYIYHKKLFLSAITNNRFSVKANFKDHDIKFTYIDFLPNAKDSILYDSEVDNKMLHIVVPGDNGMQSEYIADKQQKAIKGMLFTFNNPIEGAINLVSEDENIVCYSSYNTYTMSMDNREEKNYSKDKKIILRKRTLHTIKGLNFVLKEVLEDVVMGPVSTSDVMKDGARDALIINVHSDGVDKLVTLYGGKGYASEKEYFKIGDLNFSLSYGSKYYNVPFSIELRDFQLERYPGSMSPSSFAAEVNILDNDLEIPYRIYMNNVLQYKGFRFFQSSYDEDEMGTILSVNHDWWGTLISYIGYFFLGLGFILVFFYRKTRMYNLTQRIKKITTVLFFSIFFYSNSYSQELDLINNNHINNFEQLIVQDNGGRLKPVHTLTSEYVRKIYGKNRVNDANATQVVLGMMYNPLEWSKVRLIKVSSEKARKLLGVNDFKSRSVKIPFNDFFNSEGSYILASDVELAYAKSPKDRSKYDNDIIKIDERVNICFTIFNGGIFRFFPLPNDTNNTWFSKSQSSHFSGQDSLFVSNIMSIYFRAVHQGIQDSNWNNADSIVNYITRYQLRHGAEVIPNNSKIKLEILYNKLNIFSNLSLFFFLSGIVLLFIVLLNLFYHNKLVNFLVLFFKWLIASGFILHTVGLAMRWIISSHAPWSNGYESMIYIAWATLLAGIIFSKRSNMTLAATALLTALLLMVAHLNWLDPEITNLVPVLKSYWLMIHVAIITASYGFLGLGAILAIIALWLIIFLNKYNFKRFSITLEELTLINEKSLQIGLFMLTIGTFLGGIWANESWGRYWGWDPKETWALVSILIYAFVLHMRMIPKFSNKLVFNIVSMFAIWTIIMTYFGVNYYLSGLHSYAAGDPMPIPQFVYYLLGFMFMTLFLSINRYKKYYK